MKLRILCEKLLIISQRFFDVPPFRFYALAEGIRRVLAPGTFSQPIRHLLASNWSLRWPGRVEKFWGKSCWAWA
jgi:hypothetical protein